MFLNSPGDIPVCFRKKRAKKEELGKFNLSEISVMLMSVERNSSLASRKIKSVAQKWNVCPVAFFNVRIKYLSEMHNRSA